MNRWSRKMDHNGNWDEIIKKCRRKNHSGYNRKWKHDKEVKHTSNGKQRIKKERIPNISNTKLNRKHPTEKPKLISEEQVRKDATHQHCGMWIGYWERAPAGKHNPHKVKISKQKKRRRIALIIPVCMIECTLKPLSSVPTCHFPVIIIHFFFLKIHPYK